MKILYFGTACSPETFQSINQDSKCKASAAPQHFQNLFLKGFIEDKQDISVITFLPMAHYPISKNLLISKKEDEIFTGLKTSWLPAINLIGIKQVCYMFYSGLELIKWNWKNRKDAERVVIIYGMYLPVSLPLVLISKMCDSSIVAYVNDLPELMFKYTKQTGIKKFLVPIYNKITKYVRDKYDGYILVSKQLGDIVNLKNKPSVVVEAFADVDSNYNDQLVQERKKAIMYAGTIHKKFGLDKLLCAFREIEDPNLEFWVFGTGDMEEEIMQAAKIDHRIIYYGMRPWEEVLEYEKRATLLINPRFSQDEYTKYSFPSKTMEYMLSGTPVLMTRLKGIDEEYFKYVYLTTDESINGWKESIQRILSLDEHQINEKGRKAQRFIVENKNLQVQIKKVANFLNEL